MTLILAARRYPMTRNFMESSGPTLRHTTGCAASPRTTQARLHPTRRRDYATPKQHRFRQSGKTELHKPAQDAAAIFHCITRSMAAGLHVTGHYTAALHHSIRSHGTERQDFAEPYSTKTWRRDFTRLDRTGTGQHSIGHSGETTQRIVPQYPIERRDCT